MRLDGGCGNPVEQRLLLGIEMNRMRVAHGIERVAVLGHPAAAAHRYRAAVQASGVPEAEVVPHLMSDDLCGERTRAVDPRLVREADISKPRPAAAREIRKQVDDEVVV